MLPLRIGIARNRAADSPARLLGGIFDGVCAPAWLPTRVVRHWFPVGSTLEFDPVHGGEKHPVLFLMGRQRDVHNQLGSLRFDYAFGREYLELLMIVPDLRTGVTDQPPVSLYSQLYLTSFWSKILGRFIYGFHKHLGLIDERPDEFVVRSREGERNDLFRATFSTRSPTSHSANSPQFDPLRRWFAQPVFSFKGKRPSLSLPNYDFRESQLTPLKVHGRMFKGLCSHSSGKSFQTPPWGDDPLGAFALSVPWTLSAAADTPADLDRAAAA